MNHGHHLRLLNFLYVDSKLFLATKHLEFDQNLVSEVDLFSNIPLLGLIYFLNTHQSEFDSYQQAKFHPLFLSR